MAISRLLYPAYASRRHAAAYLDFSAAGRLRGMLDIALVYNRRSVQVGSLREIPLMRKAAIPLTLALAVGAAVLPRLLGTVAPSAEAQLASGQADLVRWAELVPQGVKSRQTYDQQKALVQQLQAALKADEAQIEAARLNLGYADIRAPISGRLGIRMVDIGNMVRA